jgi:PHD/YefM family antitoxin component YafN of YafNO toxin-antitoxin module
MPIDHFPLEAEISLTELRSESTLTSRLRSHHRLRIRRRNEVVGVLLDLAEWRRLVETVAALESEADRREEAAVASLIAARLPHAVFEAGSPEAADEIDREYERLVTTDTNA